MLSSKFLKNSSYLVVSSVIFSSAQGFGAFADSENSDGKKKFYKRVNSLQHRIEKLEDELKNDDINFVEDTYFLEKLFNLFSFYNKVKDSSDFDWESLGDHRLEEMEYDLSFFEIRIQRIKEFKVVRSGIKVGLFFVFLIFADLVQAKFRAHKDGVNIGGAYHKYMF